MGKFENRDLLEFDVIIEDLIHFLEEFKETINDLWFSKNESEREVCPGDLVCLDRGHNDFFTNTTLLKEYVMSLEGGEL
jgi:hypothetical protein